MKAFTPVLLLLIPLLLSAQENDPFAPLGRDAPVDSMEKQLRIQVEWFEIDSETYEQLLTQEDEMRVNGLLSSDAGPTREKLMELVKDRDARLIETAMVIARSGQRAKVESIAEVIYPTEYDAPGKVVGNEDSKLAYVTTLTQPAAFETRNVGVTLEVDPVLGADDETVDLNLAPEIVYLVDELSYGEFESKEGEIEIKMPVFYTMKTTTQVTMIAGEYGILAVQSPFNEKTLRADHDRKVLLLVKAELVHVGLGLPSDEQEEE